ncbi:hypothetical protein [Pseudidiomarina sp.]|uniref:hypothetical protein n=1 Tax=Pseudidiomarina sp. TaxID=2081707 RepID=UPI003A9772B2
MQVNYLIIQQNSNDQPLQFDLNGDYPTWRVPLIQGAIQWLFRASTMSAITFYAVQFWSSDGTDTYFLQRGGDGKTQGNRIWLCRPDKNEPELWPREEIVDDTAEAMHCFLHWRQNCFRTPKKETNVDELRKQLRAAQERAPLVNDQVSKLGFFRQFCILEQQQRRLVAAELDVNRAQSALWHSESLQRKLAEANETAASRLQQQTQLNTLQAEMHALFKANKNDGQLIEMQCTVRGLEDSIQAATARIDAIITDARLGETSLDKALDIVSQTIVTQQKDVETTELVRRQCKHELETYFTWFKLHSEVAGLEERLGKVPHG